MSDDIQQPIDPGTDEAAAPPDAMADLQKKSEEYLAGWQRAKADYENLQKETTRQRQEYVSYANQQLILDMLPVYDHFKMAMSQVPADVLTQPWMQGVQHIKKQLKDFLQQQGVEEIETVGAPFDPAKHEAVDHVADPEKADDTIVRETSGGYVMGGKVIKAAKVVVVKNN